MTKNILIDHVLDTPRPSVNEVWISKDRRDLNGGSPRTVTIEKVEEEHVIALSSTTQRRTKISIDTLVSRYKKSEPPKEAHVDQRLASED